MPLGIDFSAIAIEHFDFITQDKQQTFTLNDNLPMDIIVQILAVRERYQKLAQAGENAPEMTSEEAQPLVDDWSESVIETALAIFRNTPAYERITEEEMLAAFDVVHLFAIIGFFSNRLFRKSSEPQNGTDPAPSPSNRKARRASASAHRPR